MGPVATPAPVPVPTAAPVTSGPVQGACVYMKDAMCFDTWLYTCEGCCTTGLSSQGSSCWDAELRRIDAVLTPGSPLSQLRLRCARTTRTRYAGTGCIRASS